MRIILVCLFSFCFFGLYAQRGNADFGDRVESNTDNTSGLGDSLIVSRKDTLSNDVFSYSLDNLTSKKYFNDTLLTDFEEYEMTNQMDSPYITLGNPGSSTTPLFWKNNYNEGFNLGVIQHEPYQMTDKDINFYSLEKPYAKVYYSPGANQSSFRSSAILARDFAKNTKASIHFNRINSNSYYNHTEIRHTFFHVGLFQKPDSTNYAFSFNFLSNSNYEDFNGGIEDEADLYVEGGQIRSSIPVLIEEDYQYNLNRDFNFRGYYFISDKDSSMQYLQASVDVERELYKFINPGTTAGDTMVFSEGFITSELGMRRLVDNNSYGTRLSYHLENKLIRSFFYVKYRWNQVSTDNSSRSIQTIYGGGENQFDWKGLTVNLDGYFGSSYGTVLLDLHPKIRYQYKSFADIQAGFRLHTQPSAFLLNQLEITEVTLKDESPFITSSQELYGSVSIPVIGFKAKVTSFAGQNIPVLNSTATGITTENVNFLNFDIEERIKYKWFRFNNRFITQIQNINVYNMPQFYTEHELYFDGKLFGTLDFNAGINANFIPAYSVPAFSPFYGRYFQNEAVDNKVYYRLDPFASIKVQGFRFFVKYENLNGLWDQEVLYQALNHPQFDARLRFGVSWALRN